MRILSPEWLLLIPLLAGVGWKWRHWGWGRPGRALILAGLMALLVHPEIRTRGDNLDLWVLVDRSASAEELVDGQLPEWEALLTRSKPAGDRLHWADFAETVRVRADGQREPFPKTGSHTRVALALRHVLTEMDVDRNNRILILTDGFSTEPLDGVAGRLLGAGIALDYRLVSPLHADDVALEAIRLPTRVQVDEPFLVEVWISSTRDQAVDLTVFRDGAWMGAWPVDVADGRATLRFTDRVSSAGAVQYRVAVSAEHDPYPGNNRAEQWVEVHSGPRILLATRYDRDLLAQVLQGHGFEIDLETDLSRLHAGRLSGARAVVLNNVPAYRLPEEFLKSLPFYVRSQGGGLWMVGGEFSFGSGGYFESPIDPLLPVSMELKEEHRKLAMALAIVLDRSGSMAAGVVGASGMTKMDLANQGAARTIELLGARDQVAVFAVDSQAHTIIPLSLLGDQRGRLVDMVRRIQSGGGGIYVYTGLRAAWDELSKATVEHRHLILFSDAADSEEPGDYPELVDDMVAAGATVSVIGLGTENDADAPLLKDIAGRGGGRIFFNQDPRNLPALFAQEVVAVARSAFVKEAVPILDAGGWTELAARPLEWLSRVDGYNLSYLRPEATAAVVSGDEERAPMVAWWQRGLGRVMAVSFPLAGPYSGSARSWERYGDFVQTVARWIMADDVPPGIAVRTSLEGTVLHVDLFYDQTWNDPVMKRPPELVIARMGEASPRRMVWERFSPGHYRAAVAMGANEAIRGVIQVGQAALPFGPVTAGKDAEWSFSRKRRDELRELAQWTGGIERVNLTSIWDAPRAPSFQDARPPLVVFVLIAFIAEALVSRTGARWPFRRGRLFGPLVRPPTPRTKPGGAVPTVGPGAERPPPAVPAGDCAPEDHHARRRSRFAQAKRPGRP